MNKRIYVPLTQDEFEALRQQAQRDTRPTRDQARHIIRQALLAGGAEKSSSNDSQVLTGQGAAAANVL